MDGFCIFSKKFNGIGNKHHWTLQLNNEMIFFRKTIVCPIIDVLTYDAFQLLHGATDIFGTFSWKMIFRWSKIPGQNIDNQAAPIRSDMDEQRKSHCIHIDIFVELQQWLEVSMPLIDFILKNWECMMKELKYGEEKICMCNGSIDEHFLVLINEIFF